MIVIAMIVAAVISLHYLLASNFGLYTYNFSPDWAHHLSLTEILLAYKKPLIYAPQLGEFARFPRYAHVVASIISRIYQVSPFIIIQLIASLSVIITSVILSVRLTLIIVRFLEDSRGVIRTYVWTSILFILAIFILSLIRWLGFSFDGQVQWNFFYSQAVATALALLAYALLQVYSTKGAGAAIIAAGASVPLTYLIGCFHTVPAIWFGATCAVLALSSGRRWAASILIGGIIAVLNVGAIMVAPGTRETLRIMQVSEGVGGLMTGPLLDTNLAAQTAWIGGGIAFAFGLLLLLVVLSYRRGGLPGVVAELCGRNAGLVALVGIAGLLIVKLWIGGAAELYPLAKFVYFLGADLTIGLVCAMGLLFQNAAGSTEISRPLSPRDNSRWAVARASGKTVGLSTATALALAAFSFAQYHNTLYYAVDQSPIIAIDKDLRATFSEGEIQKLYPQFPDLTDAENYFLAISALNYPRYPDTTRVYQALRSQKDLASRPEAMPPAFAPSHYGVWTSGVVDFSNRGDRRVLVIGDLRPMPPGEEQAAFGTGAMVLFGLPDVVDRRLSICLKVAPPELGLTGQEAAVYLGPEQLASTDFSSPETGGSMTIPISLIGRDLRDVRLWILNLDASGASIAAGRPGVRLSRMWMAPTCSEPRIGGEPVLEVNGPH